MTYTVPGDAITAEKQRHRYLAEISDPSTRELFETLGVGAGWRCLEIGMGGGSVPAMLVDLVGKDGYVLATDIDLRLQDVFLEAVESIPQLEVRQHDISVDALPDGHFDLAHARATLEHVPDPDLVLRRMAGTVKPGGWVAIEGGDFSIFDSQPLPHPFGELMAKVREMTRSGENDHHDRFYLRGIQAMRDAGLVNIGFKGSLWGMEGGKPNSEWLSLAMEWGMRDLVDNDLLKAAIAQSREKDFLIMSPCHVALWGQVPQLSSD